MTRTVLRVFLASVGLNAALGVYALLVESFGDTQGRILSTSLSVSGAVLLALACEAARERGRLGPLPAIGTVAAVLGFVLVVVDIWTEPEEETLWKVAGSLLTVAVAAAVVSLLSLPVLAKRFRRAFTAAAALAGILAAMLVSAIWGQVDSDWFWRWLGVVAVLLAACSAVIPVLHRAGRRELAAGAAAAPSGRVSYCPSCGRPLTAAGGVEATCAGCGSAFTVRFAPG